MACLLLGSGGAGIAAAQEADSEGRVGEEIVSSEELSDTAVDNLVETAGTSDFYQQVSQTEYIGEEPQISSFDTQMQEFPNESGSHVVLSSGRASNATNSPSNFASTDVNGRTIPNYSPDNYEANDVAELKIDFTIPEGVEGVALDYQFASEESPEFLGSSYQDFCEVLLFLPDGSVSNIGTLPDGEAVTVDNASDYSNVPGGDSQNPQAPLPEPQDITYNAVTELLTAEGSVAGFGGQEARIIIRIADASDAVYDSAVLFDNLRFLGEIEQSTGPIEQALNDHRDALVETVESAIRTEAETEAEMYNEFGSEYAETVINYHGYNAGEIAESELDADVLEVLDETTTQVEGDNTAAALESYNFYSEMYAKAETVAPGERADLFEQYLLGTHPEQEANLIIGDSTLSAAISNYEEEVFPSFKEEFLTQIEDGDYSNTERQQIISFIRSRTTYVQNALGQTDRIASETIDSLLGDGDVKGQSFRADVEQINQEDTVEEEAVVTGTIVAVGSIVLHKIAAAAVVAKGYASLKAAVTGFKIVKVAKGSKLLTAAAGKLSSAKTTAVHGLHWWSSPPPAASVTSISGLKANLSWVGAQIKSGYIMDTLLPSEVAAVAGGPRGIATWGLDQVVDDIDQDLEGGSGAMPDACLAYQQRSAEITGLDVSSINLLDSFKLNIAELDFLYEAGGKYFGKETGTVTIENTSSVTFTPNPELSMKALNTSPYGNDVEVQHPIVFRDPIPQLEPGEEATLEIEYAVPLAEKGTSSYEMIASLKNGSDETTTEFDTGYLEFDIGTEFDLLSGVLNPGESAEENYAPESDTQNTTCELNYTNNDIDLHITDSEGNHTGMNYETSTFEDEIPEVDHSGNDDGTLGNEYATISDYQSSEYTVEAISPDIGTIVQGSEEPASVSSSQSGSGIDSEYDINVTETTESELAATADLTVSTVHTYGGDEELTATVSVDELKQSNPLNGVELQVGELSASESTISSDNVSLGATGFDVSAGGLEESSITVSVPSDAEVGTYTAEVEASANDGSATDTDQLVVNVFPEGPDVAVGNGQNPPQDLDNDGLFENVSGDGETSVSDVQLLFDSLEADAIQNNPAAFNFSGTEDPQEVQLADVQALYNQITEE